MKTSARIAPRNSLLLVMDKSGGEIPLTEVIRESLAVATASCIAVGTLMEYDGETSITLTDEVLLHQGISEFKKVFDDVLDTPEKEITVCTVLLHPVLSMPVKSTETEVEIWANHSTEPDKLWIVAK